MRINGTSGSERQLTKIKNVGLGDVADSGIPGSNIIKEKRERNNRIISRSTPLEYDQTERSE